MLLTGGADAHAVVGGKAVFAAPVDKRADTAGKVHSAERDLRNGDHDGAGLRKVAALQPEVGPGKGRSAVFFQIPSPAVKVVRDPVDVQAAREGVRHAEDAVAAFHGEKAEGAHDVGAQRREGAVGDLTPDPRKFDGAAPG